VAALIPSDALRPLLEEFLASPAVGGIEYIERGDVRTVIERFLACCEELGRAPRELQAADLSRLLRERLALRYAAREALGQRTIDVLRTFLIFLEPELPPERARALRVALEEDADEFRALVRGEG